MTDAQLGTDPIWQVEVSGAQLAASPNRREVKICFQTDTMVQRDTSKRPQPYTVNNPGQIPAPVSSSECHSTVGTEMYHQRRTQTMSGSVRELN